MNTKSKTERALIAVGMDRTAIILATDGEWIGSDVEQISASAEDIGLWGSGDPTDPGLYLWEGTGELGSGGYDGEPPDPEYDGTVRKVEPDELAELLAMEPPNDHAEEGTPCE